MSRRDDSGSEGRREFLKRGAMAVVAAGLSPASARAEASSGEGADAEAESVGSEARATRFDPVLMVALGDAVLPESLGAPARARSVTDFIAWIGAYRPVSEEMHGYGQQEITYTPSDPAPGWRAQLDGLELLARRVHGRGFALLDIAERRALIAPQLPRGRSSRLPSDIVTAPHIAIALMAHWAASSAATDLVYGVAIGKDQCRVLAEVVREPLPLAPPGRK